MTFHNTLSTTHFFFIRTRFGFFDVLSPDFIVHRSLVRSRSLVTLFFLIYGFDAAHCTFHITYKHLYVGTFIGNHSVSSCTTWTIYRIHQQRGTTTMSKRAVSGQAYTRTNIAPIPWWNEQDAPLILVLLEVCRIHFIETALIARPLCWRWYRKKCEKKTHLKRAQAK